MPSLALSEVSLSFGARTILRSVNFNLPKGRRIALAGANGSGKSTLMRILVGELAPDSGGVVRERDTRVAYLPQAVGVTAGALSPEVTVYAEVEKAFREYRALEGELRGLEQQLGGLRQDSPDLHGLLERHHDLQERLEAGGYHRRREAIERVLQGLGFARARFHEAVGSFSQGWQMRVALARVLCENGDILLLDEPTNFLDLEARQWLERHLQETAAAVLVVSHDRAFLDATVQAVAELYQGRLSQYPGSYSEYERRRVAELERAAQAYERQQEEITRMEAFIRRFRYNASKARLVQSRIGALERIEPLEPPPVRKAMSFAFPDPPRGPDVCLVAEGLEKRYGQTPALCGVSFELLRGEKVVLVGPNGAGKSTLMRILAGRESPSAGTLRYAPGLAHGYYSPEELDHLGEGSSVLELVESWAPTALVPKVRNLLGAFLFRDDEVYKSVTVLSGGEHSRLALLRLLLQPAAALFLDEPTNHLDLQSKDVLLETLRRYQGTVVFVSHDRLFIEGLATRVVELREGRARLFPGDYAYYLWRTESEGHEGEEAPVRPAAAEAGSAPTASQASRLEDKRLQRELRRLGREEEGIVADLEGLHGQRSELERSLAREEVYRDGERVRQVKRELEEIERREELKRLVGLLMSQKLDHGKPLWEMWVIEGLEGDRLAILARSHHSMVDGIAGVGVLRVLLRPEPDPSFRPVSRWRARPAPGRAQLVTEAFARRAREPLDLAGAARRALRNPSRALRTAWDTTLGLGESLSAMRPASPTPLNPAHIGPHRRIDWLGFDLSAVKEVRHQLGGTLNDVVLATVAGALRRYLRDHRVAVKELDFRVMCPVSMRHTRRGKALGNRVVMLVAALPVDERNPRRRLERVIATTRELKASHVPQGSELIEEIADWTTTAVVTDTIRLATWLRAFNLIVTNVPGPPMPLYLLGARVLEMFPLVPLYENQALGFALLSYAGGLYWGLTSDWDRVPDLHDLTVGLVESFEELRKAT